MSSLTKTKNEQVEATRLINPLNFLCTGERNERVEQLEGDISEMKMIFQHSLEAAVASRSNGIV